MFTLFSRLFYKPYTSYSLQFMNNNNELFQISQFMHITHTMLPLYLSDTNQAYVESRVADESNSIWGKYITG